MGWSMECTDGIVRVSDIAAACDALVPIAMALVDERHATYQCPGNRATDEEMIRKAQQTKDLTGLLVQCPGKWELHADQGGAPTRPYTNPSNRSGGGLSTDGREEWEAIAPFVESGSFVEFTKDGEPATRWVFRDGRMMVLEAVTLFVTAEDAAEWASLSLAGRAIERAAVKAAFVARLATLETARWAAWEGFRANPTDTAYEAAYEAAHNAVELHRRWRSE